jgi:hypothetical protein
MNTFQPAGVCRSLLRSKEEPVCGVGRRYVLFTVFFVSLCLVGCSQGLDKRRFSGVHGTARTVNHSLSTGVCYHEFSNQVLHFSHELSLLTGKKLSDREQDLLKKYKDLLAIYEDGLLLWKYKLEGARYHFIPEGVIYVGQDVEPVVEKYRFSTESHVYAPTKQVWKSIPGDSLHVIWQNADSQLAIIEAFPED